MQLHLTERYIREEMNRNERFLSIMSILPWNCLVAGLNIHTFDWHCRKDTSNWILITERIPFGKQDGDRQVDPAYDKMKDTLLIAQTCETCSISIGSEPIM